MISKEPFKVPIKDICLTHEHAIELMKRGVERAIEESRKMGVPIPIDTQDGSIQYELPDGSIVQGDP